MTCADVGTTNPDIGGIGIIIAFALQALLSIFLSLWSFVCSYKLNTRNQDHKQAYTKKREILDAILLFASDTQTLNGIALPISGLSQVKSLEFYHLHIVYDTVSFTDTSISNCAAIVCSFRTLKKHRATRFVSISFFLLLYLAFTIAFGIRLKGWDEYKPGHCYNTKHVARADAKHPYVDNIYLAITCFVLIGVLEWAFIGAFDGFRLAIRRGERHKQTILSEGYLFSAELVLFYAVLQCPLHLYSVIALRVANKPFLQGDSENTWGFGQVVAMIMFGASLIECCKGYGEWRHWKKHPEQEGSKNEGAVEAVETIAEEGKAN